MYHISYERGFFPIIFWDFFAETRYLRMTAVIYFNARDAENRMCHRDAGPAALNVLIF